MSEINVENMRRCNLPFRATDFRKGHGETVWVEFSDAAIHDYHADVPAEHVGVLRNDPYVYSTLFFGQEVRFKFRPGKRPAAVRRDLMQHAIDARGVTSDYYNTHMLAQARPLNQKERTERPHPLLVPDAFILPGVIA